MKDAYKYGDGKKIDDYRVLVDVERGRTVRNWRPRRLGGGLGNSRAAKPKMSDTIAQQQAQQAQQQPYSGGFRHDRRDDRRGGYSGNRSGLGYRGGGSHNQGGHGGGGYQGSRDRSDGGYRPRYDDDRRGSKRPREF
jgi:U1 small nuclear ribonucleoprotein